MWSSKLWGAGDLYFSRVNYSGPTLGLRQCGQVALRAGGDLLYLYSLLHYPSLKLDSHLLQTRMIRTQRLYDTRSLHTTLGPLPGLCQPGTTGGGQCSTLIAYFYWAPITWSWSLVNPIRPLDGIKPRTSQDLAIRTRGTFTWIAAVSLSCGVYLAFNLRVWGLLRRYGCERQLN